VADADANLPGFLRMKLASLRDGTRDGRLLIVSSDLKRAAAASGARTMLAALENWSSCEPLLREQADGLETSGAVSFIPFDENAVLAPLPKAPQWLDGSAYRSHSELVCAAWQTPNPFNDLIPLMYQGASDDLLPWHGPSYLPDEADDIDLEAEVAVVVDDVPMGIDAASALSHIKLVMLINDVSLRAFGPPEMQRGFGFLQAKPSTVFSPVAVTVDSLGESWQGGRLHLPMNVFVNQVQIGSPNAKHMFFSFGDLIAHAAKTRRLSAGSILGSGTVSDPDRATGSATLVELRAVEKLQFGEPRTAFLKFGDRVEIEARDARGRSIFGRIDHQVLRNIPPNG
jgi:fumarylacetoacetate (FAA) hydrolase